jgi:uncharacterized heparinase superfamily protein
MSVAALRRLGATVRHLSLRQIAARAGRIIRMRLLRATGARLRPAAFVEPIDPAPRWNDPALTQLERYHLHYFEWVDDLAAQAAAGERVAAYAKFRGLVGSWLAENARIAGDGWHPYTVSLRSVNWIRAAEVFAPELVNDALFAAALAGATLAQLRFLSRNVEFDVRGNHIIENVRALIAGGLAFEGAEPARWLARGLAILEIEVAEQVLADGGHFERVPAYHVAVTRDLLEIARWLRVWARPPSGALALPRAAAPTPWLLDAICRMLDFLDAMIMADGRLALLKDTTYGGADPHDVLAAGAAFFGGAWQPRPRVTTYLPQSGYAIFRPADDESLIVDVGAPCPDYLPAHAHADMFSFELVLGGRRVIVDSGVYTYAAGEWRDFFRSTRAHNTVEVEGENQSDVWSSFRVGRRAKPHHVRVSARGVRAEHDGYQHLRVPVRHRRTIRIGERFIVVRDELLGSGTISAASRIHIHPDAEPPRIVPLRADAATWTDSWYSERFGEKRRNRVLVLTKRAALPFTFGYIIDRRS